MQWSPLLPKLRERGAPNYLVSLTRVAMEDRNFGSLHNRESLKRKKNVLKFV